MVGWFVAIVHSRKAFSAQRAKDCSDIDRDRELESGKKKILFTAQKRLIITLAVICFRNQSWVSAPLVLSAVPWRNLHGPTSSGQRPKLTRVRGSTGLGCNQAFMSPLVLPQRLCLQHSGQTWPLFFTISQESSFGVSGQSVRCSFGGAAILWICRASGKAHLLWQEKKGKHAGWFSLG